LSDVIIVKNRQKTFNAWAIFDSANSAHALVITAAVFPVYYLQVTEENISVGNWQLHNGTLYAFILSFSYLLVAIMIPLLSGIADYGDRRMWFMKFFTYLGGIACIGLFFFTGMSVLWIGLAAFMLSLIGFAGGLVFYNSYLPLIATEDKFDRLSARGFSFGYFGSVLLLLFNLAMITYPTNFGLADGLAASRWSFLSVGIWWILLAQIPFSILPKDRKARFPKRAFKMGFYKIRKVWREVKTQSNLKRFLASFFMYSVGVQTIILLAATFAESVMEFGTSELIMIILIIQLVAIIGAYLFAFVSEKTNNKVAILIQLFIWVLICVLAYKVETKDMFYLISGLVGMVLGGIQSLSRSSYAKLINRKVKSTTSYFSFYDVLERMSIVLGTFIFGAMIEITGSMRYSALTLTLFFVIGIILMTGVKFKPRILHPMSE